MLSIQDSAVTDYNQRFVVHSTPTNTLFFEPSGVELISTLQLCSTVKQALNLHIVTTPTSSLLAGSLGA
ncbi:unnamed protein product [Brassica rapa subsp. narinosa]